MTDSVILLFNVIFCATDDVIPHQGICLCGNIPCLFTSRTISYIKASVVHYLMCLPCHFCQ